MSALHNWQYLCVFIWLLNEPVRVCAPNVLALAVSPETRSLSLCTFLRFLFFFFYGSVCVYLCVFMSAFFKAPYRISTFTDSQSTEQPHPPSLCFCRWTAHLVFMKQGSKLSVSPLWTAFILPAVSFTVTFLLGRQPGLLWILTMSETKTKVYCLSL